MEALLDFSVDLEITVDPEQFTEDATSGVVFTLTATNLGTRPDTIELETISDAVVVGELSREFVTLEAGESATIDLKVTGTDNTPGRYPLTVRGISRGNREQIDSVTVTMIVVEPQVLSIEFDFDETQTIHTFLLTNRFDVTLRWRAAGPTWVMTTPSSGEVRNASVPVQIEIDFDRLPPRTHHERLQFIDLERPDDTQAIRLDVNRTPRFEPIAPQRVLAGVFIEFRVSVTDPDLDNVTLSIDDLPDGAMFDATTGLFNWRTRREQAGQYALKFRARDDFEASAEAQEIVEIELLKELEFTLRLFPGETQMIHVPFRDPAFRTDQRPFHIPATPGGSHHLFNDVREIFRAYTSHSHPNSSDDLVLEPWTGFVIVNRSTAPLRDVIFRGQSYAETDIPLKRGKLRRNGINLIGLPLRDPRIQTMTDLGSLHPSIINVIGKVPQGRFRDVPADEFFITGGQSFIVIVSADTTLSLSGAPWENAAFSNPFIANAPDAPRPKSTYPNIIATEIRTLTELSQPVQSGNMVALPARRKFASDNTDLLHER